MNFTFIQDPTNAESTIHETVYYYDNGYDEETGTMMFAIIYKGDAYWFGVVEGTGTSGMDTAKGSIQRLTNTPTELKEYFLGADYKGRPVTDFLGDLLFMDFKPVEERPDSNLYMDLWTIGVESNMIGFRYNQDMYMLVLEEGEDGFKTKMMAYVDSLEGNVGKYVKYKDLMWIVFRDDSNGVELLSANILGEVSLGGTTLEEAKEAYNSGITIINDKCKEETGITTNIRNVGGPAVDTAEIDETTGLKQPSTEYQSDIELMKQLGVDSARSTSLYWLGERMVNYEGAFFIRAYSAVDGYWDASFLTSKASHAVRPIIWFEEGYLDQYTQKGTWDDPIKLD